MEGFEGLAEFAGDTDGAVGREFGEDFEGGGEAVGGLEEEGRFAGFESGLELLAPFAFFDVEEAVEGEGVRWEAGGDKGGCDGGGAGKDGKLDPLVAAGFEKAVAGVREAGGAGIGNDSDLFAVAGAGDEFGYTLLFVVIVERDEGAGDFEMVEEAEGVAGILAGDEVGVAEGFDRTQGDVAKVTDGSGDEGDLRVGRVFFRCHLRCGR